MKEEKDKTTPEAEEGVAEVLRELGEILRPTRLAVACDRATVTFGGPGGSAAEPYEAVVSALVVANNAEMDPPTTVFVPGYFEQYVVQPTFASRVQWATRGKPQELPSQDGSLICRISKPSLGFFLAVLGQGNPDAYRSLFRDFAFVARGEETGPFSDRFLRGFAVSVEDKAMVHRREHLSSVAESALFNYAFGNSEVLVPARSWDPFARRTRRRKRTEIQFPRRVYNSSLVSYYQLSLASENAFLSYLSLYNVIEHFFSEVSEQALRAKLVSILVQPDFSHAKAEKIRDLASTVRGHDKKYDERALLRLVIENKIDLPDLAKWIRAIEKTEGQIYTSAGPVFGLPVPVDLHPDKIAPSLAARIYHIRCLLVHNKEAEAYKYVPFSNDDDVIRAELPLMLHIAESLIVSTGTDL